MKGVLIVRQIMAKKEILLHRINQMSRISAFCDHLALINYASEIAPVGQAASQAPQSTQASASISYLPSPSEIAAYWTFAFASTTAYTFITNYVCHCMYPPFLDYDRFFPFRYPHFNTRWGNIQEFLMYLFE